MNAVIYARYSSHNQTEQSIEGQLAAGHKYAQSKGYTDQDKIGKTKKFSGKSTRGIFWF